MLAAATSSALESFARHWPKAMGLAVMPNDAGRQFIAEYAHALLGCDLAAIPHAALRWVSENERPPKPRDFAMLARQVSKEMRPPQYGDAVRKQHDAPALPLTPEQMQRIEQRARRIHSFVKTWRGVGETWALLLHTAPTPDAKHAVRVGDVPLDVVDEAIKAYLRGSRAPQGPLSAAVL